ncbi:hypothetical protein KAR91_25025 [Candidatus Pacearchaeota archaeon]|nr:hypothetical protein [Candidatus Pacearchaeota archaeon]
MIGIYQDNFVDYLKENLGGVVKITHKNIVCRCPWCEVGKERSHYHLWIGLNAPIFKCFGPGCDQKGVVTKVFRKISGDDKTDVFVDKDKVKEYVKQKVAFDRNVFQQIQVSLPELRPDIFKMKYLYIKKRLKFHNVNLSSVKGLVFDVDKFIEMNDIAVDERLFRLRQFLQTNFVGFVSENQSICMFRNIDPTHQFKFFKMDIQPSKFLDYYKLLGGKRFSTNIVLGEGIFDIYTEHIFDSLNLKSEVSTYASGFSVSYEALVKSIVYHEQLFRPDVHIISDNGVHLNYYRKVKRTCSHLINTMSVYYNRMGKDFNDTPCIPEKFII